MTDLEHRVEELEKEVKSISAMINRDIPLKARRTETMYGGSIYNCPVCKSELYVDNHKLPNYCPNCGQRIDGYKEVWQR